MRPPQCCTGVATGVSDRINPQNVRSLASLGSSFMPLPKCGGRNGTTSHGGLHVAVTGWRCCRPRARREERFAKSSNPDCVCCKRNLRYPLTTPSVVMARTGLGLSCLPWAPSAKGLSRPGPTRSVPISGCSGKKGMGDRFAICRLGLRHGESGKVTFPNLADSIRTEEVVGDSGVYVGLAGLKWVSSGEKRFVNPDLVPFQELILRPRSERAW